MRKPRLLWFSLNSSARAKGKTGQTSIKKGRSGWRRRRRGYAFQLAIDRGLRRDARLDDVGPEGFRFATAGDPFHRYLVIASTGEIGALYGAFTSC